MTRLKFLIMIWFAKLLNPKYWRVDTRAILAQAAHETGNFSSNIFVTNKNLFGMKKPSQRPTKATGENAGHATFKSYWDSIIDYFQRQKYFKISGTSTDQFINDTLKSNYAEDPEYYTKWLKHYEVLKGVKLIWFVYLLISSLLIFSLWFLYSKVIKKHVAKVLPRKKGR